MKNKSIKSRFILVQNQFHTWIATHKHARLLLFYALPTIIVCLFFWQYLFTGNAIREGDFDYYAQLYEAFRISVLKYHQFPWWNPWMSGGLPLYANPQFGLISIQSLTVLALGSVYGLKIAYVLYAIAGFWGMYSLARMRLHGERMRALLISFLWIAGGFFGMRSISHFTFALFFLFPWLVLLVLMRRHISRSWLWFGSLIGLIGLSSLHYAFLFMLVMITVFFTISLLRLKGLEIVPHWKKDDILFLLKSGVVFIVLVAHRLFATMTYLSANERVVNEHEVFASPFTLLKAITLPIGTILPQPGLIPAKNGLQWGWTEYTMYVGFLTVVALLIGIGYSVFRRHKANKRLYYTFALFAAISLLAFLLALGDRGAFSPYHLLRKFPGFTQTRVPSRWMIFAVFSMLCSLAIFKRPRRIINMLLLLSCVELFIFYGPIRMNGSDMFDPGRPRYASDFEQYDNNRRHSKGDLSYLVSTQRNRGQFYADDSIINTLNYVYNTQRCGINIRPECDFVLSDNADVVYWSPNKFILKRTKPGAISLNMNPYYLWRVNGTYSFLEHRRLDPDSYFIINDPSDKITVEYVGKFSPEWVIEQMRHRF